MSACYECSLCGQQYSDLNPAMQCCEAGKAAMTGISGQALMSLTQAAEEAERERIVAYLLNEQRKYPRTEYSGFAAMIAEEISAKEHLK